jgi:hypothetical protein
MITYTMLFIDSIGLCRTIIRTVVGSLLADIAVNENSNWPCEGSANGLAGLF